ncbi:hypothetical protein ONE63_003899 [Megalurothrips usitatus]|uniref:Pickpocket protein 28-like n=1 Tax=Megalurothrips usitatus TaxID=439358 RepID=A0AAV7X8R0_9NEOP|nr:hypothetical protein ONE63_003899 [Megalurothrips usitatus]
MFSRRAAGKDEKAASEKPWQDAPAVFWVKEYGAAARAQGGTPPTRPPTTTTRPPPAPTRPPTTPSEAAVGGGTREKLRAILQDYLDNAYVAGVPFLARHDIGTPERLLWVAVVAAAVVMSVREIPATYARLSENPISVDVRSTAKIVQSFPFPAVAICPKMKIRKREAINVNGDPNLNESLVLPALELLQGFRVPYWMDLRSPIVHPYAVRLFAGVDLRDFMSRVGAKSEKPEAGVEPAKPRSAAQLPNHAATVPPQVAPDCESLIAGCLWAGHRIYNCCSTIFEPVMSNAGKCFVFNSHFPVRKQTLCRPLPEDALSEVERNGLWYHQRPKTSDCNLARTGTTGVYSGLEVFMKFSDPEDMVSDIRSSSSGFEVVVSPANEHVDVHKGVFVAESNLMATMAVVYAETSGTGYLRSLPPEQRECLFEQEVPELFKGTGLTWYTQETCISVCRTVFLAQRCGCYPYIAAAIENQCNLEEYRCFIQNSPYLYWVRTPASPRSLPWERLGTTADERNASLWPDCRACLPMCSASHYRTEFDSRPTSALVPNYTAAAFINVFVRDHNSAVQYKERQDTTGVEQLASYLFTMNLLLGISIMSMAQLAFYVVEVLLAVRRPAARRLAELRDRCWRPATPPPPRTPTRTPTARTPTADHADDVLPLPYVD